MTICSKNVGVHGPFGPPGYAYVHQSCVTQSLFTLISSFTTVFSFIVISAENLLLTFMMDFALYLLIS